MLLNWIWKPKMGTTLNTGVGFRSNNYSNSALNWYQAADPRPDYYKNMPYYYTPAVSPAVNPQLYEEQLEMQQMVADYWVQNNQINWDALYDANYRNFYSYMDPENKGRATYILENRHSNFNSYMLNSYLDHRLSDIMTCREESTSTIPTPAISRRCATCSEPSSGAISTTSPNATSAATST